MVDSRQKGARAESTVRDALRELTGLKWERVPMSGALDPVHGMKGDLYIPNEKNLYCVEVKHYKDSHINHALITGKNPQLVEWWLQTSRQAKQTSKHPLLIFKHDRSKLFCAFDYFFSEAFPNIYVDREDAKFFIALLEDFIKYEKPKFI